MDTSTVVQRADTLGRRVVPRRFRSVEDKLQIIAEARATGSVAAVARKHGVNANLVFAWMRLDEQGLLQARSRRSEPRLLAVSVAPDPPPAPEPSPPPAEHGHVEIALSDGISVRIFGAVPSERIEQVLRLLRR
jgi:transposase